MQKYLNSIADIADIIEDSVDVLQQLRYGNEVEARLKLLKVATAAMALYNHLANSLTTGSEEGE